MVEEWLERREAVEDCTCQDELDGCWFRLTPAQRLEARVESFREMLEAEGDVQ